MEHARYAGHALRQQMTRGLPSMEACWSPPQKKTLLSARRVRRASHRVADAVFFKILGSAENKTKVSKREIGGVFLPYEQNDAETNCPYKLRSPFVDF